MVVEPTRLKNMYMLYAHQTGSFLPVRGEHKKAFRTAVEVFRLSFFMFSLEELPAHQSNFTKTLLFFRSQISDPQKRSRFLVYFFWGTIFTALEDSGYPPEKLTVFHPENRPKGPQKGNNRIPTNHPFSGVNLLLVSGRVYVFSTF